MQAERAYGIHTSLLTLTPAGGSAVDCRPDHIRWNLEINATLEDATAAMDAWEYPLLVHRNFRLTLEIFPSAATAGGSTMQSLIDALINNVQIGIVLAHAPPTGSKKFDKFTGSAITESFTLASPKGPVVHTFVLRGQGAMARTAHDA